MPPGAELVEILGAKMFRLVCRRRQRRPQRPRSRGRRRCTAAGGANAATNCGKLVQQRLNAYRKRICVALVTRTRNRAVFGNAATSYGMSIEQRPDTYRARMRVILAGKIGRLAILWQCISIPGQRSCHVEGFFWDWSVHALHETEGGKLRTFHGKIVLSWTCSFSLCLCMAAFHGAVEEVEKQQAIHLAKEEKETRGENDIWSWEVWAAESALGSLSRGTSVVATFAESLLSRLDYATGDLDTMAMACPGLSPRSHADRPHLPDQAARARIPRLTLVQSRGSI